MPDLPAHRGARFVAQAIGLTDGQRIVVCTPFAPAVLLELKHSFPSSIVDLVTHDLRTAEAARAARAELPVIARAGVTIYVGDGPAASAATPDAVLLWPNGWEGHARIRAQILQALSLLPIGGRLYLLANQNKGAPALLTLLRRFVADAEVAAKGPSGLRLLEAVNRSTSAQHATPEGDDEEDGETSERRDGVLLVEADVLGKHFIFRTTPGVFSHLTVNAGTRYFLQVLEDREHSELARCRRMLDLGCGYGPLGIVLAAVHPEARVVLADVDSRAVELAAQNVALNGLTGRVEARLSDGLRHLDGFTFDAILSHFPLHVTREEQTRLIRESHDALAIGGGVYLCALAAYDLRPPLRAVFGQARVVAEGIAGSGDRYRVLAATKSGGAPYPVITLPGAEAAPRFAWGATLVGVTLAG